MSIQFSFSYFIKHLLTAVFLLCLVSGVSAQQNNNSTLSPIEIYQNNRQGFIDSEANSNEKYDVEIKKKKQVIIELRQKIDAESSILSSINNDSHIKSNEIEQNKAFQRATVWIFNPILLALNFLNNAVTPFLFQKSIGN